MYSLKGNGSRPAHHKPGKVFLVGAGPGDPDLLTIKAAKLIHAADVILHDALVSTAVLALASTSAQILEVGKRCGKKNITQEEINRLLIEFAGTGKLVVRLKSGDPLIFGRAGEELQALREAKVETEVVPGISAAFAGAASAQILLTDRRYASRVTLVSAHRAEEFEGAVDWSGVVNPCATLIVYMPGDYKQVSDQLVANGMGGETPCLVISKISSTDEISFPTTLRQLPEIAAPSPSILIIGGAVRNSMFHAISGCRATNV